MRIIYIFICFIFLLHVSFAQVNTDSLFNSAISDSRIGKYEDALKKVDSILQLFPERHDIMIFAANVNAWNRNYEKALLFIEKAYILNPFNDELYDSWLNILLWSKDYKKLIEVSEIAKKNNYTNNYNIVYKKAIAYKNTSEYNKGILLIEENQAYLDSTQIKQLYIQMLSLNKSNAVSFFYGIDFFDNNTPKPEHLLFIDYAIKINKNTLIPRLNYANRFKKNDFHFEADYYHVCKKGRYLYSNFGMSIKRTLFPEYRAGLELYFPINKSTEASLGGRFLKSDTTNDIIATGNINTYYKNMWFMFRPFYVISDLKNSFTTVLGSRYYLKNPINYWELEFISGNSPDERYSILQSTEQLLLNNYRVKLKRNTAIFVYHELKLSMGYSFEEILLNTYRNRYTIEILLKFKI